MGTDKHAVGNREYPIAFFHAAPTPFPTFGVARDLAPKSRGGGISSVPSVHASLVQRPPRGGVRAPADEAGLRAALAGDGALNGITDLRAKLIVPLVRAMRYLAAAL